MSEDLMVRRLKAALDVAPADPTLRRRVISSLPLDRQHAQVPRRTWAPAVAAVLAIAVVVGLVWANPFRSVPGQPAASVPLSECQLPVFGFAQNQAQHFYEVGFLDVSTGKFTPVPSYMSRADETLVGLATHVDGFGAITYSRAGKVWLPVKASWSAPDGMSYVYQTGNGIHLRSLRSNSDRLFLGPPKPILPPNWNWPSDHYDVHLIGWSGGLIYYALHVAEGSDLWTLDPKTGKQSQVVPMVSGPEWWWAGPNAIWGSPYYTFKIARYDTKTHLVSSWSLDDLIDMIGLDSSGDPIIVRGPHGPKDPENNEFNFKGALAVMRAEGSATSLGSETDIFDTELGIAVVSDGDRIWLWTSSQKLWVYSPGTGLLFLDQSSNGSLPGDFGIAGGCVTREEVRALVAAAK